MHVPIRKNTITVVVAMAISATVVSFAWLLLTEQTIFAEEFFACNIVAFDESCDIGCPDGYANDDNGCPVCECLQIPAVDAEQQRCETLTCPKRCEDYVMDEKGCPSCECADTAVMAFDFGRQVACDIEGFRESCDIGCPDGYANDENGCPQCRCLEMPAVAAEQQRCETRTCPTRCEDYQLDASGCVTCECAVQRAQPMQRVACDIDAFDSSCAIGCPGGYANDENGCPVCECLETPSLEGAEQRCKTVTCPGRCEDYQLDKNGCPSCDCG